MRFLAMVFFLAALLATVSVLTETPGLAEDQNANVIEILDNCDPEDPAYDAFGGCFLKPKEGDVSANEFFELLFTPLDTIGSTILIGHPSWRNEPSYISTVEHRQVQVRNRGGRGHTFTEVEDFGGGFVPELNAGLEMAPECNPPETVVIAPKGRATINDLGPGLHKFQCCIHPWMRAAIRVQ